MQNIFSRRRLTRALLLITVLFAGCGVDPGTAPGNLPPPPSFPAPTITSVTGDTGSTDGGASVTIVGTGFHAGVVALFGDRAVVPRFDSRDTAHTTMFLETPPHAAGPVDIVVRNPDGQSARAVGAHTYVAPATFDANGTWSGDAFDGSHRGMRVVVQNGRVVSTLCAGPLQPFVEIKPSAPIAIAEGAFTVTMDDHELISGRMVAPREMVGTMDVGECTQMSWRATPPPPGR
jgi:IPT/TIG domain-containing protein